MLGSYDITRPRGSVSSVSAGKDVTAVVIKAINNLNDIESTFSRAAAADIKNAAILGQFDTYMDLYKKCCHKNKSKSSSFTRCVLCVGNKFCEICSLKSKYEDELLPMESTSERILTLDEITDYLLQVEKPPLECNRSIPKHSSSRIVLNRMKKILFSEK